MKRINILHFSRIINKNDFIDVIIRHADRSRFNLMAASYRGEANIEDPLYDREGIPYFNLNIDHGWIDMIRGACRLSRILIKQKIDIVHSHHFYESIIAQLACLLAGSCKHIIGRHYHNQFYLTASGFKLWFYLKVESITNKLATKIVVPSTTIVDLLREQQVNADKIEMIPYAFDFTATRYNRISDQEISDLRQKLGWSNRLVIGNISRHHIIKGQTYLIKAFSEIHRAVPNCRLVFIGDGPLHEELINEVNELGLTTEVEFLGWRRDSHKLLNCLDIVVHPTLQEAFPQIMIEAMALGKPILITPVSGATDVIQDKVNGILIEPQNPGLIVKAIMYALADKVNLSAIGANAEAFVRTHYSVDKIIPRFEQLYSSLVPISK